MFKKDRRKSAKELAVYYELGFQAEYMYQYILDSYMNGNKEDSLHYFLEMDSDSQKDFMTVWLDINNHIHMIFLKRIIDAIL